jgi:hypothetical protein
VQQDQATGSDNSNNTNNSNNDSDQGAGGNAYQQFVADLFLSQRGSETELALSADGSSRTDLATK